MARDREHFELPKWEQPRPRRVHGGGSPPHREDRNSHGAGLVEQADRVAEHLQERQQNSPAGINPQLVFKLQLHPSGRLEEDQLQQMGLRVLARNPNRAIVVFPDHSTLDELRRRLREYAGLVANGHDYGYLAAIDAILELTPEDRTGPRLSEVPLQPGMTAPLDVELWHSGSREECSERLRELREYLESHGLRLTDSYIGQSLFLVRAQLNSVTLEELLRTDYIKEIDRRPEPNFEMGDVAGLDLSQLSLPIAEEISLENLVGIVIVDSGVMQGHPALGPVLGDAQVFPDRLGTGIAGGAEDGDERNGGHGTAVAGIAVYSDVGSCIEERSFVPRTSLFSARVTDENNEYDDDELIEHQLQAAVEYFLENYPQVKVINISLGDGRLVYSDQQYQFRLAAVIDELAIHYQNRNIVFVISAGNFWPADLTDEQVLAQYPAYLMEIEESRVIDPATSALAITVGGLSYGRGEALSSASGSSVGRLVAGERGWPSPFTRTGWGVDGSVKPDVVDYAGDLRFENGQVPNFPTHAGLPTTAKAFAPPEGRLFRTVSGTSFAAPRVANLAARLFGEFPDASSNLIRALIADSARIPENRPTYFRDKEIWDEDILRVYGCGQPDFTRSRWSDNNEVLLLAEDSLEIGTFQIYTVPSLPPEFLTNRGCGYLSVTLAFDPPTRHTRMDSYLGNNMEFALFRNVPPEDVANAIRKLSDEDREEFEEEPTLKSLGNHGPAKVDLQPGRNRRMKGTLQRGTARVRKANWNYDGEPLQLAVTCRRKWAPAEITHQRFAVVVSLWHDDPEVNLYEHVRQQTRVSERIRIRT